MRKIYSAALIFCAVFAMQACRRSNVEKNPTIPYVRTILASRNSTEMDILQRSAVPSSREDLSLIAPQAFAEKFAERFVSYDVRDNVNGRLSPDGLADFAGETLFCIFDDSLKYAADDDARTLLREKCVRLSLAALDTSLHISPYDIEGMGRKKSSKVIILGSPLATAYGMFDVDTLMRRSSCNVPVISPIELSLGSLFHSDKIKPGSMLNIGIIYDSLIVDKPTVESIFNAYAAANSHPGSTCFAIPADSDPEFVSRMVHRYVDSGHGGAIDAVIVDDIGTDVKALKNEIAGLVSVMNESSITYSRYFSEELLVVDSFEQTVARVYGILRDGNLFTHNISMPLVENSFPAPMPDSEDGSLILVSASYVQNQHIAGGN